MNPSWPEAVDQDAITDTLADVVIDTATLIVGACRSGRPPVRPERPWDPRTAPRPAQTSGTWGQADQLLEMERRERLQSSGAVGGHLQADHPMVVVVPSAPDKTGRVGPVDQTYRTVMPEEQIVGDLADGRTPWVAVTSDGQEELMFGR